MGCSIIKKDNSIKILSCPIRLPLLVLVRTAFGMISRSLDNNKNPYQSSFRSC